MHYKKTLLLLRVSCGVLLAGSLALITLSLGSRMFSSTVTLGEHQASYYQGTGQATLLVGSDTAALASALPLLRTDGGQVLSVSASLSPQDWEEAVLALSTLSGQPSGEILVAALGDAADSVIRWYFDSSTPVKALVLLFPSSDSSDLIDEGIYSCSFPAAAKILILDSASMPASQIDRSTELYNLLSGDTIKSNGNPFKASKGNVSMLLSPGTVLYDAPLSSSLLEQLSDWLGANLNLHISVPLSVKIKPLLWLLVSAALGGFLYALLQNSKRHYAPEVYQIVSASIPHPWRFTLSRILIPVLSLLPAALLYLLMRLLKLPPAAFGSSFISYAAACGAVILLLYRYGGMPGVKGSPTDSKMPLATPQLLQTLGIVAAVAFSLFALGFSGFYTIGFSLERGILFVVLWGIFAVCLRSVSYDATLIEEVSPQSILPMLLFPYLPVLALAALAVPMGELSMAVAILKCTFVLICAIILNRITDMLTASARWAAFLSALILAGFLSFYRYI